MTRKEDDLPLTNNERFARFRFAVVGELFSVVPQPGELKKRLQKLADKEWHHPITGKPIRYSFSSIERWYYQSLDKSNPMAELKRPERSDYGKSRVMTPSLISELLSQYQSFPHWSYKLHSDNLISLIKEKPELGTAPSYTTVRRLMKKRGWLRGKRKRRYPTDGQKRAEERLENREVRSYEVAYVHALWHLDFHTGKQRVVDDKGVWHKPQCLCILDDKSRLCCHIQWYLSETAEVLVHGICQALQKRGLPKALLTDNGAAMRATETTEGLQSLGIIPERTLEYSPYQNGKQESFWGNLEGRLMAMLTEVEPLQLDFLNHATQAWAEQEYNRSIHEEIGKTPIEALLEGPEVSRICPEQNILQKAFTQLVKRRQRRSDGTVVIDGVRFEIPNRFRGFIDLRLRFRRWDLAQAWLVDPRDEQLILATIYPLDKVKNADRKRREIEPVEMEAPKTKKPIPPLLRQYLQEYAATGLPPAYIPLETNSGKEGSDHA